MTIKRFITHWGPVIGFCLVIFIQSSRPFPDVIPDFNMVDKLLHFSAWTLLAFLFFRAYREKPPLPQFKNGLFWVCFFSAALYGMSDEIHQHFVPSRTADILDFAADAVGSFCGTYFSAWRYRIYRHPAM